MTRSPNRLVATAAGAIYLVLGIVGFAVAAPPESLPSSGSGFIATSGPLVFGVLQVNGLQNVVHVLAGVVLVLVGRLGVPAAKTWNATIGTLSLAFGLLGVFLSGTEENIFAFNGAANALHFAIAIVLLTVSLGAEKPVSPESVRAR